MNDRKGEKLGWTLGWLGGFSYPFIQALIWLIQGRVIAGIITLAFFIAAVFLILKKAPWKYPDSKLWKLMGPIYLLLFSVFIYIFFAFGGLEAIGMGWWPLGWCFSWFIPASIPLFTIGRWSWNERGRIPEKNEAAAE